MTIQTGIPFPLVFSTVNGEVLAIVIEGSGHPGIFRMAALAICGKLCAEVIRVCSLVEIFIVAADTSIGGVVVIPIMAGGTVVGNHSVRPIEHIVLIVNVKSSGHPVGLRAMAYGTIHREAE